MPRKPGRPPADDVLTPAEWRVVEAVRHGSSNPVIARRLGISLDAVKYHVANALQKLGFASRVQLRVWDGVARYSQLGRAKRASTSPGRVQSTERRVVMGNNGILSGQIGQIARSVRDVNTAKRFFGELLGLPHMYTFGNLAFFDCQGVRLMLSAGDGPGGAAQSILYFRVADIHQAQQKLAERGVRFTHAPHMIHRHADGSEEWMAFFADQDEAPLALTCLVPAMA
jgi:DNA-binding CsgD family transcriptional regulator/predicted enzyme related to lactoylglutathione lyase